MLRFRPDHTFTIVQFTDTHFRNGEETDAKTLALMTAVLDAEQPDLVIVTGDLLDGKKTQDPAAAIHTALAPVAARGLPWAVVFGNHDDEGVLDRRALLAELQSIPGCLSEAGPVSGVGNFVLPVLDAQDQPAARLYCLDSNSYSETALVGYGWIRRDQIAWYEEQARRGREEAGRVLPALAFFHIPLPEYDEVWDYHTCFGSKREPICCPRINTGFFAALHEAGEVMGTFVGHDHINDFEGDLFGIRLCYGLATGYGTYGPETAPRGARVIRLTEGVGDFTTWMRLEGGAVVTELPLHPPTLVKDGAIP
jgi:hypothetical protein